MFRALSRALDAAGFGSAALFDVHPDALLALQEAAWERHRLAHGLPEQGLRDPEPRLRGFGSVETANGRFLGEEATLTAAKLALLGLTPPPTLAWAWLVEGAGLVEALSALVWAELGGQRLLTDAAGARWLRSTEALFGASNLLAQRSPLRSSPAEQRAALYTRAFGAPVQPEGVLLADEGFTATLAQALAGDAEALGALRAQAEGVPGRGQPCWAAGQLVSWFFLSLSLDDSPVVRALDAVDQPLAGRLEALCAHLGRPAHPRAAGLVEAAEALDALLRGSDTRAALAGLWPGLEGSVAEDPESGAGDLLAAAFPDGLGLGSGPVSFGDELEPGVLTVTDTDARVRSDPPTLALGTAKLAFGSTVVGRAVYPKGGDWFVQVAPTAGGAAQWTKLTNLRVSPGTVVGAVSPTDSSQTGPFAAWSGGKYIGQLTLWLVGGTSRSGLVLLSEPTLLAFLAMSAQAAAAGVTLTINSGFRSYPEQKALHDLYKAGRGNLAARPGTSNHQSGIAIDLSVQMGSGNPSPNVAGWTPTYRWLVRHGREHGFMRTVSSEAWHWEHRPGEAAEHDTFGSWTALKRAEGG